MKRQYTYVLLTAICFLLLFIIHQLFTTSPTISVLTIKKYISGDIISTPKPTEPGVVVGSNRVVSFRNGFVQYSLKESPVMTLSDAEWNNADKLEEFYHSFTMSNSSYCSNSKRYGAGGDGGWTTCLVEPYQPKPPCYSFSFGVSNVWGFDDQVAQQLKCEVFTFDPSMSQKIHQRPSGVRFYPLGIAGSKGKMNSWPVDSFKNILKRFSADDKVIDIFKIDVEYSEWATFETATTDGSLTRVKQLMIETHSHEVGSKQTTLQEYQQYLRILKNLHKLGFRKWLYHWNHFGNFKSSRSGRKDRTCCHESYYININFLKSGAKLRNPEGSKLTYPTSV